MLLQVQRKGDSGSPRVKGATRRSNSTLNCGSVSVKRLRPPPGLRNRELTSESGSPSRAASSTNPLRIVFGDRCVSGPIERCCDNPVSARAPRFDVFVSHSSAQARLAARCESLLEAAGLSTWLDQSEIRAGTLLRNELHQSLRASRLMLLLWSEAAAHSRWVAAELLTAFHEKRFIMPAAVDETALPYFLSNALFLDLKGARPKALATLADAVRRAPRGPTRVPPFPRQPGPGGGRADDGARALTGAGHRRARPARPEPRAQAASGGRQAPAHRRKEVPCPRDRPEPGGHHRKNAYMLKHWERIQAGQAPKDRLLVTAERFFFDTLFVNPNDCNALNGLGSILTFERDLDAAEFFVRAALAAARRDENDPAAEDDLKLILWLKGGTG